MMPPPALIFSFCPSPPTILGMLGPWMSMSTTPTSLPSSARLTARFVVTVLLPTPPLLLMTRTLWRMTAIRLFTSQRLWPSLSFWQVSFSSHRAQAHIYVQGCDAACWMTGNSPGMWMLSPLDLVDRMLQHRQYDVQVLPGAAGTARQVNDQGLLANPRRAPRQHGRLHFLETLLPHRFPDPGNFLLHDLAGDFRHHIRGTDAGAADGQHDIKRLALTQRHQPLANRLPLVRYDPIRREARGNGLDQLRQRRLALIFFLPPGDLAAHHQDRDPNHRLPAGAGAVEAADATSAAGLFLPNSLAPDRKSTRLNSSH